MLKKAVFLVFIFMISCKSLSNSKSTSKESFDKRNDRKVLIKELSCKGNENLVIEIDESSSVIINPNLCETFEEYISQKKVVYLSIKGNLNNNSFNGYDGFYKLIEYKNYLDEGLKGKGEIFLLEFSNFGFIEDTVALKKRIDYKVFSTNFDVVQKRVDMVNSLNNKCELRIILKPNEG